MLQKLNVADGLLARLLKRLARLAGVGGRWGLCLRAVDGRKTCRSKGGAVLGMADDFGANVDYHF